MKSGLLKRKSVIALAFFNLSMFIILAGILILYFSHNQDTLLEKDLDDIVHLTDSSSNIATSYVKCHREKLIDIRKYAEKKNMSLSELNEYMSCSTYKNVGEYKLIDMDGNILFSTGEGKWNEDIAANENIRMELKKEEEDMPLEVNYLPEFVVASTGEKVIGVYTKFYIKDDSGKNVTCILANVYSADNINKLMDFQKKYDDMSFSIIDGNGRYMVNGDSRDGDDFFLKLLEMNIFSPYIVNDDVSYNVSGSFFYYDKQGDRVVFSYSRIIGTDWFVVSRIKMHNLSAGIEGLNITLFVTMMLISLIIIDIAYMYNINEKLIYSMENTKMLTYARNHGSALEEDYTNRHEDIIPVANEFFDIRAYVIDNEFPSCDNVSRLFERIGIYCEWGMTGKESLRRITDCEADKPFNMFFIQWELTDMKVAELVDQIREIKGQDVTIIILADEEGEQLEDFIKNKNIAFFATKPLFMSELMKILYDTVDTDIS